MRTVSKLDEYNEYFRLEKRYPRFFKISESVSVNSECGRIPLLSFTLCDHQELAANAPVLGLFAGVHGIEAIGVKILLCFVDHLLEQTEWNGELRSLLGKVKLVGIPIVNPAGFIKGTRSNGNGVDLMRNAPIVSSNAVPFLGGQCISSHLPYYQGEDYLEIENVHLADVVRKELWNSVFSVALDLHSGFGTQDYLWTPWAKQKGLPPHWNLYSQFFSVMDRTLKNHVYKYEPQSVQYCTHGDIWDYHFEEHLEKEAKPGFPDVPLALTLLQTGRIKADFGVKNPFLPITLEVGSWAWVRKSPRALLNLRGIFNPTLPHREKRVLRRHIPFLNILMNAVAHYETAFLGGQFTESEQFLYQRKA